MYYLQIFLYTFVLWHIFMMPVRLAHLNKKENYAIGQVRMAAWLFGWTGIGWIYAMVLAFAAKPAD